MDNQQLQLLKKLSPAIFNKDGSIKSFKEQLLEYEYGIWDTSQSLVLAVDSSALNKTPAENHPIVMNVKTLRKLQKKHDIALGQISELPNLIVESNVLMLESYTFVGPNICMYLDVDGNQDNPLFAVFHLNKNIGYVQINELISLYERKNIEHTILQVFNKGLKLYPNEKTKDWLVSRGLQLPKNVTSLLCGNDRFNSASNSISDSDISCQFHALNQAYKVDASLQDAMTAAKAVTKTQGWLSRTGVQFPALATNLVCDEDTRKPVHFPNVPERTNKEEGHKLERLARLQLPEYYFNCDLADIIRSPECLFNNSTEIGAYRSLAQQGFNLDMLINHPNPAVRREVEQWLDNHGLTIEEYIIKYPEYTASGMLENDHLSLSESVPDVMASAKAASEHHVAINKNNPVKNKER